MDNVIPFPTNKAVEYSTADVLRLCVSHGHELGIVDSEGLTHLLEVIDIIEDLWISMAESE